MLSKVLNALTWTRLSARGPDNQPLLSPADSTKAGATSGAHNAANMGALIIRIMLGITLSRELRVSIADHFSHSVTAGPTHKLELSLSALKSLETLALTPHTTKSRWKDPLRMHSNFGLVLDTKEEPHNCHNVTTTTNTTFLSTPKAL